VVAAVDQPRVRLEVAEPGSPARLDWLSDGDVLTIGADQWRLGAVRNPAPTSGGAQGSDAGQLVAVLTREPARP
jgi:hypothetical protein